MSRYLRLSNIMGVTLLRRVPGCTARTGALRLALSGMPPQVASGTRVGFERYGYPYGSGVKRCATRTSERKADVPADTSAD